MTESKACVADAAGAQKVSASRAREIVARCQEPINAWTDGSMRNACSGECDFGDSRNVQERADRKAKIEEILMMSISDEVHPKFVRM